MKNSLIIALLCLNTEQAQAIHRPHNDDQYLQYRPYVNGRTPWYARVPAKEPDYPYNYPVAQFGVDRDVEATLKHAAGAEARLHTNFNAKRYDETHIHPFEPKSYAVPSFGADKDVVTTQKNLAAAETTRKHKWTDAEALRKAPTIPRGYAVANFGQDREITGDFDNLAIVEKRFKHKLSLADIAAKNKKPTIPSVHDWGMDHEIKTSLKNLADTEKRLGVRFTPEFVQTFIDLNQTDAEVIDESLVELESDPICASAGCTQYKAPRKGGHPMNYFVPNFGMDSDIADSMANQDAAEASHGAEIPVPKKEDKKTFVQLDLGVDTEIKRVQQSIKEAEHDSKSLVEMNNLPTYI